MGQKEFEVMRLTATMLSGEEGAQRLTNPLELLVRFFGDEHD